MKKLRVLIGVGVLAFAFGACGRKDSDKLKSYEKLVDKFCACKDEACMDGVTKEMHDFKKNNEKPDEETMKKVKALNEKMTECMMKNIKVDGPGGDQAAPQ